MRRDREARDLADALDSRAADAESAARGPDGTLPGREAIDDRPFERFTRAQWREAGVASTLREVARAVRSRDVPLLRALSWLAARQVECDCAVDEAMGRVTTAAAGVGLESAVAWSAYVMGRAKGVRVATELCRARAAR